MRRLFSDPDGKLSSARVSALLLCLTTVGYVVVALVRHEQPSPDVLTRLIAGGVVPLALRTTHPPDDAPAAADGAP